MTMENEAIVSDDLTPAEELRRDLRINHHALEQELLKQPTLYDKYSSRAAEIRAKRDALRVKLKVRTGEIAKDLRISGIPGGIKVTESAIQEAIDRSEELATISYALSELDRDLNLAEGVVEALRHKKSSLDNLVYLATSSYYQTMSPAGSPAGTSAAINEARRGLNS